MPKKDKHILPRWGRAKHGPGHGPLAGPRGFPCNCRVVLAGAHALLREGATRCVFFPPSMVHGMFLPETGAEYLP